MEIKLDNSTVYTVQIDGKDVEVVSKSAVDTLLGTVETEIAKETKEATTKLNRDLSKRLGVNVFDETEFNTFLENNKNKIDKSELEKHTTRIAELEKVEKEFKDVKLENTLIKKDVNLDYKDKVSKLIDIELGVEGTTIENAVEKVLTDFPMFKKTVKRNGLDINSNPDGLTERELYLANNPNYKNNPYYKG